MSSTDKYNLLFLAPRIPWPLDTGAKIRTYNLLKYIGKTHRVTLVCFLWEEEDSKHVKELEKIVSRVAAVRANKYPALSMIGDILFGRLPMVIKKYISREMKKVIAEISSSEKFDIIHCDHLHMAYYGMNFSAAASVLDEHNIEHIIWQRYSRAETNIFKRALYASQWNKMREYEKRVTEMFDCCCVVSEGDGQNLKCLSNKTRFSVINNGVDIEYFKPHNKSVEPDTLVFTGSMNWLPNEDAMLYFIKEIWPLVKKNNSKLYVVGTSPSKNLIQKTKAQMGIEITGRVDDVRPYIAHSGVYIVPLRIGGGSRLKILEAMAMGKAVVSTSVGFEGIDATPNENIVVADDPRRFAEQIVSLSADEKRRNLIGERARRLVESKYSWEIIGKQLEGVYSSVCKK